MQVDHETTGPQVITIRRVDNSATTGCEHDTFPSRQVVDDFRFAFSEASLAFLLENERDIDAGPRLDLLVAIDEVQVQEPCELPPDGRFAGAHGAHQEDVLRTIHNVESLPDPGADGSGTNARNEKANPRVGSPGSNAAHA